MIFYYSNIYSYLIELKRKLNLLILYGFLLITYILFMDVIHIQNIYIYLYAYVYILYMNYIHKYWYFVYDSISSQWYNKFYYLNLLEVNQYLYNYNKVFISILLFILLYMLIPYFLYNLLLYCSPILYEKEKKAMLSFTHAQLLSWVFFFFLFFSFYFPFLINQIYIYQNSSNSLTYNYISYNIIIILYLLMKILVFLFFIFLVLSSLYSYYYAMLDKLLNRFLIYIIFFFIYNILNGINSDFLISNYNFFFIFLIYEILYFMLIRDRIRREWDSNP